MTQLSASDLVILHTKPHRTRLNLSIFQPRIVLQCQVNDVAITKGARTITYNNVTLGGFASVEAGMTLYIGTTAGARDVGKIRIRSATATQFLVSENSNIQWANGLFLTVIRYWDVFPIYPQIIQDPTDVTKVIFYKDYDIAYTNQNSILGTFLCAGPHQAEYLDGGLAQIYYSATGSFNFLGSALSYDWAFEGGTPTGSTLLTPGWINYNTHGQYVTRLIVSGSNGSVDTTYRYISIYDRPQNGGGAGPQQTTPQRWNLTKLDGSRGEGGYTATIRLYNPVGDIVDGACVVITAEDWYGGQQVSLGGNAQNAQNTFFSGYILRDSINWNYEYGYVEFDIGSITEVMKQSLGFAIDVESKAAPITWYQLLDLDARRAMYHFLKWHTTVLSITDFQFVGQDRPIQYFDSTRESMYDAISSFMQGTLVGEVVADRQGKIWAEIQAEATPNATGTFNQIMLLNKSDWMNQPVLTENIQNLHSYLEYGGIAYSGPETGTFSALLACAPGNAPSFRGDVKTVEGLALSSQTQLNQLVGNVLANQNARFPQLSIDMAGNYRNLDIAPQETVRIPLTASDTSRGLPIDQLYIVSGMTWNWDSENEFLYPKIDYKAIVAGNAGDTITIPVNPVNTAGGGFGGGFNIPPFVIPPFSLPTGTTSVPNLVKAYAADGSSYIPLGYNINTWGVNPPPSGNPSGTYNPSPIYTISNAGITVPAGYYLIDGWALLTFALSTISITAVGIYLTKNGGFYFIDLPDRANKYYGITAGAPVISETFRVGGIYYFDAPTIIGMSIVNNPAIITNTLALLSIYKLS